MGRPANGRQCAAQRAGGAPQTARPAKVAEVFQTRRYSTTFRILRNARVIWRRTETGYEYADQTEDETTLIVGLLTYAGSGWRTTGDALLANTAAAMARERHEIAREEFAAVA